MARKAKASESTNVMDKNAPFTPSKILSSRKMDSPSIPTFNPRHSTAVRLGKVSGEINCRDPKRRQELGLPPLATMESDFVNELRS